MGRLRSEKIDQSVLGFQLNYLNCRTRPTDQMTNEGDVLGLVRLRYPLSVRFNFGYNRHILERGCEGEVPLATCGILLHSTALRCGNCGTDKRKVECASVPWHRMANCSAE